MNNFFSKIPNLNKTQIFEKNIQNEDFEEFMNNKNRCHSSEKIKLKPLENQPKPSKKKIEDFNEIYNKINIKEFILDSKNDNIIIENKDGNQNNINLKPKSKSKIKQLKDNHNKQLKNGSNINKNLLKKSLIENNNNNIKNKNIKTNSHTTEKKEKKNIKHKHKHKHKKNKIIFIILFFFLLLILYFKFYYK